MSEQEQYEEFDPWQYSDEEAMRQIEMRIARIKAIWHEITLLGDRAGEKIQFRLQAENCKEPGFNEVSANWRASAGTCW